LTAALALLAVVGWLGRKALIRWIEGPPVQRSTEPWPPVDDAAGAEPTPAPGPLSPTQAAGRESWVEPGADGCPPTHPVKAKQTSMLYHLPGMLAYERTKPDRCYQDAEAAEADGFARAKR
jgi:hypothetical protein